MKTAKYVLLAWFGMVSVATAQQSFQIANPVVSSGNPTTIGMTPTGYFVNKRAQEVSDCFQFNASGYDPLPMETSVGYVNSDRLSFNASQPRSRILINPDQFWTRKSQPIIDSRNHLLFGDHKTACDEWAGFCGCCGLKVNPGHLGQRWLRGDDPCECVDTCCPERRCKACQ